MYFFTTPSYHLPATNLFFVTETDGYVIGTITFAKYSACGRATDLVNGSMPDCGWCTCTDADFVEDGCTIDEEYEKPGTLL